MTAGVVRPGVVVDPGTDTAIRYFRMALASVDIGIVSPQLFATGRVECDDDGTSRRHEKSAFNEYRIRLECERPELAATRFVGLESPGLFQLPNIACGNLRERRILHAFFAAAIMRPVIKLARESCGGQQQRQAQGGSGMRHHTIGPQTASAIQVSHIDDRGNRFSPGSSGEPIIISNGDHSAIWLTFGLAIR